MKLSLIPFSLLFCLLYSCATTPTGRKQLLLVSEDQMATMGTNSFEDIKKKTPIERSRFLNSKIQCIANKVIRASGGDPQEWEVVVFRSKQVNAFALPGNKIGFYTGLIKLAENNDQIASVMGHEVGHVLANHGGERVSQNLLVTGVTTAANLTVMRKKDPKYRLILMGLGVGAQFGYLLPFSRKHESEADRIGVELMARAGFRPEESYRFWQRMSSKGAPPEFMSTHPSNKSRIENLMKLAPQARTLMPTQQAVCP